MAYIENYGSGLHRLIYISRSTLSTDGNSDVEVAAIAARAAAKNRALGVTGVLLAYDGWFLQTLEGSYETLQPLYERICADSRHREVRLKAVEPAKTRLFDRWGMKQGRTPTGGCGFDIGTAEPLDLINLLKISALWPARRAA